MKKQLREKSKITRKNLNCEISSEKIAKIILEWNEFKTAANIMIYHPINNEIDLLSLCKNRKKNFYLPQIDGENILPVKFNENTNLVCGKYKIPEPCSKNHENIENLDLIFVPALCADKKGFRIGYGKGFYDRFITGLPPRAKTAIVTYEELLFDEIPAENFDKKCNFVISPSGIINC